MDNANHGRSNILIIDDDVRLCRLIDEFFSKSDYAIQAVHNGATGLARALDERFDLILLDIMLPGLDGFEVLTQLRRRSSVPVIMLTARGAREDCVQGLNTGADDYLAKPFGPEELAARIAAVLRRSRNTQTAKVETISFGRLRLNAAMRSAWIEEEPIEITSTEFDILDLLARAGGKVVTRDQVCGILYQRRATPFERSLEVHISRLRRKTQKASVTIRSIRGVGYVLAGDEE
ncbi:MAG: response regulator transcription factor [Acidobacteriaceae bacterium]|nr:response regulator transcription factor [Acidobacteriaceae bacterium]